MKKFSQGMGRLTPDVMNNWQDTARAVEQMSTPFSKNAWEGPYLMTVMGSTEMLDENDVIIPNRWRYDLNEVSIDDVTDTDSWSRQNRTTDGEYAINLFEANNTASTVMNVDVANLPSGFSLQPVDTGAYVWAFFNVSSAPEGFVCIFTYTNQFDGSC